MDASDDPASALTVPSMHIKALRAKLREVDENADPISTHRGMGYSLREELP
jgi:two-component system catabolic regulation response regulator CreB